MSHVMCHVSRVTCHMSRVTCHMSKNIFFYILIFFFVFFYVKKIGQSGGASRWRVCYQRELPRLVSRYLNIRKNYLFFLCLGNLNKPDNLDDRLAVKKLDGVGPVDNRPSTD